MKILGIGVDITNNKRIKSSIRKKNFIKRIFSRNEIRFSKKIKQKTNYFAKRYAAKSMGEMMPCANIMNSAAA